MKSYSNHRLQRLPYNLVPRALSLEARENALGTRLASLARLRVVLHFSSGTVERAKRERA